MRDEQLRDVQSVVAQKGLIGVHEMRLAHGGERLEG
jgi:hypothetical protein